MVTANGIGKLKYLESVQDVYNIEIFTLKILDIRSQWETCLMTLKDDEEQISATVEPHIWSYKYE
jgi:hypothetical protein